MNVQSVTVGEAIELFGDKLDLTLEAGQGGLENELVSSDVHRPALALAGFVGLFTFDRAQILGNTEMLYILSLPESRRPEVLKTIYQFDIPAVIVTDGNEVLPTLRHLADERNIPLLTTSYSTTKFAHLFSLYLDDVFAPHTALHGSLVDVYGIGLLLMGRSGIGKSEIAIDLVERGHRLVADDVVLVSRKLQGILVGTSGEALRDHMEIRGLGILNVRSMFGVRATRLQKRIEVIVKLVEWNESTGLDRIGLEEDWAAVLDVEVPQVTVPIYPGKNITVIAEAIAMNYQLKIQGYHTAHEFNRRLVDRMNQKKRSEVVLRADVE
ncbi:MAG: HPr(Ser) kinase/phosphatase [Gemmatimonadetes bacterium]|nr:HPr(Ser) kinase/phosphatase [Gemmatimonadota bacterium]|tara:strand:+ start:5196 stop:6170 length:975 start_codon:yes stop_codon:yes gene_type:complete